MKPLREVFAAPALIALVSLVGLMAALVGDGLWDGLSWLSLGGVTVLTLALSLDLCRWPRRR